MRHCVLLLALVCSAAVVAQRRRQQPHRSQGNRIASASTSHSNQDEITRLGLLAGQLGVAPVPGGSPGNGDFGPFPGGANQFSRDDSCWCQPVNQVCTLLRPENLDLVTRIVNPGGTSSLPGQRVPNCQSHQRVCCPHGQQSGALRKCGTRTSFGTPPAISPTTDFGEYPWMAVVLGHGNAYIAGAVLISETLVLTAAHKLDLQTSGFTVRLGDYDVGVADEFAQFPHYEVPVSQVIYHPNFDSRSLANDVALLRLAQPIPLHQYKHVTPACLPARGQKFDGQTCFVTGWGKDAFNPGNFQRKLQEVDVPVVDSHRCEHLLRKTKLGPNFTLDKFTFMCAGGERGKDACQGDGGSPLVCNSQQGWTVVGLVAWGVECGHANVPAAYVNVASYTEFIKRYIQ